jgi:galactose-1-phosphate uridylyltransferase
MQGKTLRFEKQLVTAPYIHPDGREVAGRIEVRTSPLTGRTSRIAFNRAKEKEAGTDRLPDPPPDAARTDSCPFCHPQLYERTPCLAPPLFPEKRLVQGESVLFPNLFPYGRYSAVSLFGRQHFVEIGTADLTSYTDCFINCARYLETLYRGDPRAEYMAITQNHLPSAGGSLVHPHLQVHADRVATNYHRFLARRCADYFQNTGRHLFSDYLAHEVEAGSRTIGRTGEWHWMAAFAPEGFYEIWGILPGTFSLLDLDHGAWQDLALGVLNTQRFYRSLCRNGYNLGLLCQQGGQVRPELRVVILARANYAAWVRNDHTGYEVMLGDMTTFTAPEDTARLARAFWP